ncbi:hypothetical protein CRUP_011325 [Coryphaenoides rupestris]|nr:hypothetical protein CRUP_011325 [Coryphaenoides rupestris]
MSAVGCELGQFRCGNGMCIPAEVTCDQNHFQCLSDSECVPDVWVCDDEEDCEDGSDERQQCPERTCTSGQFRCNNGACIPNEYRCDLLPDCSDGSDERGCHYPECTELRCANGACYNRTQHCNQVVDCRDSSDEANCSKCIRPSRNCLDTETPLNTFTQMAPLFLCCSVAQRCSTGQFACGNGECVPQRYVCDHDDDCGDRSDEQNCTGVPSLVFSNGRDLLIGDVHGNNLRTLIQSQNRGVAAGVDFHHLLGRVFWTDTVQNKVVLNVSVDDPENLAVDWVNNKLYVVESRVNRIDVVDLDGRNRVTLVAENLGNPKGLALDPTVGFMFFSDWGAGNGEPGLERAYMDGTNRYGISAASWAAIRDAPGHPAQVCTGGQRYDYVETALRRSSCSVIPHPFGLGLFEHNIYYTDWTKMAVMKANKFSDNNPQVVYTTSQTPRGLAVIHSLSQPYVSNPCDVNRGGCEQICILSHRSDNGGLGYRCKCRMAFDLHTDGKRCVGVRQFLLVSSETAVRGIPFNLSSQEDIILPITGSPSFFVGVDYSAADDVLAANRVDRVEGLAYDWISKNLYWTDPQYRSISVMKLADKSRRAILRNLQHPHSIVAKIMRAWCDGSHAVSIVNTTLSQPNGLAIDWSAMRLYWVDAFFHKIEHSGFDGQDRQSLGRVTGMAFPFGLTVFEDLSSTCHPDQFQCPDHRCLDPSYVCDGDRDCADGADEQNCVFNCTAGQFKCSSGRRCIDSYDRCDGVFDCEDLSDELGCHEDSCSDNNAGCTHGCLQGPYGAQCTCPPAGYRLSNDSKTCVDVDECEPPGLCSQQCFNERGSFRCHCLDGYTLEPDQHTCRVSNSRPAFLLVASRDQIILDDISSRPNVVRPLVRDGRNIVALDFDSVTDRVFWSDTSQDRIWSAHMNGSDRTVIFDSGVTVTESLAVDWVGRNLYWTDYVLETVEVARLDGSHRTVLVSQNVTNPRGLVLDPREGAHFMFWTDWGRKPRIERASMDGQLRVSVVSGKLYWPNGLTIDYPNRLLYFADAYLDFIDYCDYDGNKQEASARQYVNRVIRAHKWHGGNQTVMLYNLPQPMGLVAVHPARQPAGVNHCAQSPCTHICLLSAVGPSMYSCACPSGWTLAADQVTCARVEDPFLVVVRDSIIYGISLNPEDKSNDAMVPVAGLQNGYDVDFDDSDHTVYWVEHPGEIHRVRSDGTNRTEFAPAAILGSPVGLALDWISENLYYTNPSVQSIEVLKLRGEIQYRKTLITNNGSPTGAGTPVGIAVDPARGGIPGKVASADMDGANTRVLFTNNLDHVEFLTLDLRENKLNNVGACEQLCLPRPAGLYSCACASGFMLDRGDNRTCAPYRSYAVISTLSAIKGFSLEGQDHSEAMVPIERGDPDGTNRITIVTGLSHPWGVAVHGNYLYFTDRDFEVIERVDKASGANRVVLRDNVSGLRVLKLCLPRPAGLYSCACASGFMLDRGDNRTCAPYRSYAVISTLSAIKGFSLEGQDHSEAMVPVAGRGRNALHIDVHMSSGFIYWCDFSSSVASQNAVRRIKPDGSEFSAVITSGIGRNGIRGIAVDWAAGNLYFTNAFLMETYVEVLHLNTTLRRVLLKTQVDMPRHIVVDPRNRYLFWADYGQNPKIERALLDGTNRTVLVSSGIVTPRGLALDRQSGYVYWVDDSLDMIARVSPHDDGDVEIVRYGSRYPTPYGITVFEGSILWVDRNLKKVFRASKEPGNSELPDVLRDDMDMLRDIAVFDRRAQPVSAQELDGNPCLENNGGCGHFCFALPGSKRCGCAFGDLGPDGQSCVVSRDDFLVYTTEGTVQSLRLDPADHALPFPAVAVPRTAVALDFDLTDRRIYFTQSSGQDQLHLGAPDGIAYDWINARIYYSDYVNQSISSMAVDGSQRTVVAHVTRPRAIMLDPCRGYMYWTDWGTDAKIERATLGGNFRTDIVNSNLVWPNGLTLDYEDQRLYWADASLQKIERSSLTGENREVIVSTAIYPFAMTLFDQHIYWTDWNTRSVYRANKHDGSDQTVMIQNLPSRPMDIQALAGRKQQRCDSPCQQFNGGCSHICTPGPNGAECQCPSEGRWYLADGKHCIPDNGTRCQAGQFSCMNGHCIRAQWTCDNDNDCGDGSDELERVCGRTGCFLCDSSCVFLCACVVSISPPERTCQPEHTKCQSTNICIPRSYLCDGDNDCGDMSDESPTHCATSTCSQVEFRCAGGRCIPAHWYCDGGADCADGSDEPSSCGDHAGRTCRPQAVSAVTTARCIAASWILPDGDNDLWTRDHSCGINECTDPAVHHCDHNCTDTPTGFLCACRHGYRLMSDGRTCDDVDECTETPSVCSQQCENTVGAYVCKCAPGYLREPDGRRCRQNSNVAPYLLFSNRYYLRNLSTDGGAYSLFLQGLSSVVALDYDRVDRRVYWVDVSRRVIERMRYDGGGREAVVNGVLHGEGLAVDWVGRKLYWLDSFLDCLQVAELDGRFVRRLAADCVDTNHTYCFENPRAITLHPKYGYVFWTDWGSKAFIGRVGMDGTNKTAIITSKIEWPNGLTIDYTNDHLYWYSDLQGHHRHTVYDGTLPHPFALTVFEETVYWTDWNTRTVEKGNKYDGSDHQVLVNTTHRPFDIHVCHPYRQPVVTNPCAVNNGGCSHLCLIRSGGQGHTCECPDHFLTMQIGGVSRCLPMCTSTQYRCADNERCIAIWWKCDGQQDCRDGSDEPSTCPSRHCRLGQFQCSDGNCTSPHYLCNSNRDCHDGSDEDPVLCVGPAYRCDNHTEFDCRTNYRCVPLWAVCNGHNDCRDDSDEQGCELRTCHPGYFQCGSGHCIAERFKCDGSADCLDYTDENTCPPRFPNGTYCPGFMFECRNHVCVDPTHGPCSEDQYKCGSGLCVPQQYVCDDYDDCGDHSDELGCYVDECEVFGTCPQDCRNTKGSYECFCAPGFQSVGQPPGQECAAQDVDECEVFGTCPQDCRNTKGSYECFCAPGFQSVGQPPGQECAAQGNPPVLLLPDNVRIRRFNLSSEKYSDYLDDAQHIQALDYLWDPEGVGLSVVYWTVLGRGSEFGSIKRAYMTTFDDHGNNPVNEVDLSLRYVANPEGIAVDWIAGTMYWTDWGRRPKIEAAWMDGQQRQTLLDVDLGWPTGLTLDYLNGNRIYWCDSKENVIESMRPDGTDRKVLISGDLGNPYSVDVFEGHIYWTTKQRGEVWKTEKFGNGHKVKVLTINPWLTQVRIYQQHRHNHSVVNPCGDMCSHLCLLRPSGYTCTCPQGSTLMGFNSNECDAAIEEPVPMPPACRCMNGGTCYTDEGELPNCK